MKPTVYQRGGLVCPSLTIGNPLRRLVLMPRLLAFRFRARAGGRPQRLRFRSQQPLLRDLCPRGRLVHRPELVPLLPQRLSALLHRPAARSADRARCRRTEGGLFSWPASVPGTAAAAADRRCSSIFAASASARPLRRAHSCCSAASSAASCTRSRSATAAAAAAPVAFAADLSSPADTGAPATACAVATACSDSIVAKAAASSDRSASASAAAARPASSSAASIDSC